MLELDLSLLGALDAFRSEDVERWASPDSSPRRFDVLMHAAVRAQFLSASIGPSMGTAVEAGLAREARDAALALAARPPDDEMELAAKRLALRAYAAGGLPGLPGAMVRAALAHDARRLSIRGTRTRRAEEGVAEPGIDRSGRAFATSSRGRSQD